MSSWRSSTKRQYNSYIKKWLLFCHKQQRDPVQTDVSQVINFLASLYPTHAYNSLNTARSALSAFVMIGNGVSLGEQPLISRFMKGVFQSKPPLPRYNQTWDVQRVLNVLRKLSPRHKLSLMDLTRKTCMLIALVSSQKVQSV